MSVIGIDFGNESCYVAVARAGGIETVDNDYSLRATPSYVAFGQKQRILGVAAKNQTTTNLKNTLHGFKRLLGRTYDDPVVSGESRKINAPFELIKVDRSAAYKVNFLNENQTFSPEQVTGMLFTKLKETTESSLGSKVHDCVISCPSYFTEAQRRALYDAASLSGFNVLRLMNETTATALTYGIYKQDLPGPEERSRIVIFVDCGHSALQIFACAFNKGKLKILASHSDSNLGGQDFDEVLAHHFSTEFQTKYRVDVRSNPRYFIRLLAECEKLKKQMSSTSTLLPLNIELMDNIDATSTMKSGDFEKLAEVYFARVEKALLDFRTDAKIKLDDIHSVEIVGGSTRIPKIKALIEDIFCKPPSTTLNQDEAVARGCALQCAILSPLCKVREFNITDAQQFPINIIWDENSGENGMMEVFPQFYQIPISRALTFHRTGPFVIKAYYSSNIPFPTKEIGTYTVNGITPREDGSSAKLKVNVRIDKNGFFGVPSAYLCETKDIEAEPEADASGNTEETPMSTDEAPQQPEKTEEGEKKADKKTKKVKVIETELPVESRGFGAPKRDLEGLFEIEMNLVANDRLETERGAMKNSLEEYIYSMRDALQGELQVYVESNEAQKFDQMLSASEDWLYEDGSDEKKKVYEEKLAHLKGIGDPIRERKWEFEGRERALKEMDVALGIGEKFVDQWKSKDPKYDHIEVVDVEKVTKGMDELRKGFLDRVIRQHQTTPKHEPVGTKASEIFEKRKGFESLLYPVMNKPKAPPKEPTPPPAEAPPANPPTEGKTPEEMEVD